MMETLAEGSSMDSKVQYPDVQLDDCVPDFFPHADHAGLDEHEEEVAAGNFEDDEKLKVDDVRTSDPSEVENGNQTDSDALNQNETSFFYYDPPYFEETGVWIPVSVPPMSQSDREEWNRGLSFNRGNFSDGDMGWDQFSGDDKEITLWDVVLDMLLAARGKVGSLGIGNINGYGFSRIPNPLLEQAWKDMAQTLSEANCVDKNKILDKQPPKWLPDSSASNCMLCNTRFHAVMCSRHHCRFCGGIFCSQCSKGRSLLPEKFRTADPQRVCDVCSVQLDSVQSHLMNHVSRAAQLPTQDLTDLTTLRSWLNFPWVQSMEHEIYKATNIVRGYNRVGDLCHEKSIPAAILKQAAGIAILTIAKVGVMVTYKIGTGIVVARKEDGSWSAPSAISSLGISWGAQVGGELTDFIIVLRTESAVKTFGGNTHFSVGAGLSAAVGIVGRAAEAHLRAGDGGIDACYSYSFSKGAFVGCSLEGSIVTTRTRENSRFYGNPSISSSEILLGSLPQPPAAAILYHALSNLYWKLEID